LILSYKRTVQPLDYNNSGLIAILLGDY